MPSSTTPLLQRADHLQAGAVADVGEARIAVAAEVALRDQAVLGAVEERAPLLKLEHALGRLLRVQLRHAPVVEHLAAAHGVAEVHLPVVLVPEVAHGRRDAALGHHGVGLAEQRLADDRRLGASVVGGDRSAQSGAAGADDDDVVRVLLDAAKGSGRAPEASSLDIRLPVMGCRFSGVELISEEPRVVDGPVASR